MLSADYPEFETVIRGLETVFGKALDAATMRAYWGALRDVPLETVRAKAAEWLKRGKYFPKPFELRPKDTTPVADVDERSRRDLERMNQASGAFWDRELRANPIATKWAILVAYEARTTLCDPCSGD